MRHYATVNEAKQDLPNILERIKDLKNFFDIATMQLEQMQDWCVEECVSPYHNHGWWTTLKAYAETLNNQMMYLAEIDYLHGIIDKLSKYKNL